MTNPEKEPEERYQADAYAPPTAPGPEPAPVIVPYEATLGQRIAGGLLIANAVIVGLEMVVMPTDPSSNDPFAGSGRSMMPVIIDVLIGVYLLMKNKKVLNWAIFRAALGLVVFVAIRVVQGDMFMAFMQLAVSSSLLLLLIGDASKPRIAFGSALFSIYGLLSLMGIGATVTGTNPLAVIIQGASGEIESEPARNVTGEKSHYQITTPSDKWRLRSQAAAIKENPLADRWVSRPDVDAHVVVLPEKAPGTMISVELMANAAIENFKKNSTSFKLIDRAPMKSRPDDGLMLHTQMTVKGMQLEYLVGIVGYYEHGYQILAFTSEKTFPEVEGELRSIVESFKIPTDEPPGPPADCNSEPVKEVVGAKVPYVLTAPGDGWYLRKDDAALKDNPSTDRWLLRPDKSANLLITFEEVPQGIIDIEKYADLIANDIKTHMSGEITSRKPIQSHEKNGRAIYANATVQGTQFTYIYGLFAEGSRAYQVVAFATTANFRVVEADLQKAIETFKLPAN